MARTKNRAIVALIEQPVVFKRSSGLYLVEEMSEKA